MDADGGFAVKDEAGERERRGAGEDERGGLDPGALGGGGGAGEPDRGGLEGRGAPGVRDAAVEQQGAALVEPLEIEVFLIVLRADVEKILERALVAGAMGAGAALAEHIGCAGALIGFGLASRGHVVCADEGEAMPALVGEPAAAVNRGMARRAPGAGERVGTVRLEGDAVDDHEAAGAGLRPEEVARP